MSLDGTIQTYPGVSQDGSPREDSVATLCRAIQRGDEPAFRRFYHAYHGRLFAYLLVLHHGHEDPAREAMQETLRRVTRHIRPFDKEEVLWGWLTVLARSATHDGTRKRMRYLDLLERFRKQPEPKLWTAAELDTDPVQILQTCLQMLNTDERELLEAKYYQQKTVSALSEEMQVSEKAIESRLTRARAQLRTRMLERLGKENHGQT